MALYANGYRYRKKISVNSGQVSGTHTNFPMYVGHTDADLISVANGGKVVDGTHLDVRFESLAKVKLDHEIEFYDNTSGEIAAWVKIPSLTVTSELYMYYGKTIVSTEQAATSVWSGYPMVHHLNNEPDANSGTNEQLNSSSSSNHGTSEGNMNSADLVDGQVGKAIEFDGTNDRIMLGTSGSLRPTTWPVQISAWVKKDAIGGDKFIFQNNDWNSGATAQYRGYIFYINSAGNVRGEYGNGTGAGSSARRSYATTSAPIVAGQWHHVVIVFPNNTTCTVYVDGVSQTMAAATGTATTVAYTTQQAKIGNNGNNAATYFDGVIDEVRMRLTTPAATWVAAEFNNQNAPLTFYTLSAEEAPPDLVVSDLAQAVTLDNLLLAQKHDLVLQDLAQAVSVGALSLEQVHILAVDDVVQAQPLESVVLRLGKFLNMADVRQLTSVEGVALTQKHELEVANVSQVHTIESPAVFMGLTLVVQDLLQSQSIDPATVKVQTQVTPQGLKVTLSPITPRENQAHRPRGYGGKANKTFILQPRGNAVSQVRQPSKPTIRDLQ